MANKKYTAKKKQKVVAFVKACGRGGLVKANKKYGVSLPTLATWVKAASRPGRPKGSKVKKKTPTPAILKRIGRLMKAIDKAEKVIKQQEAIVAKKRKQIKTLL